MEFVVASSFISSQQLHLEAEYGNRRMLSVVLSSKPPFQTHVPRANGHMWYCAVCLMLDEEQDYYRRCSGSSARKTDGTVLYQR